jgi:long-chain acyl-CoA synthetase
VATTSAAIALKDNPKYYEQVQSIPEMWAIAAQRFSSVLALHDPHAEPAVKLTFGELHQQIQQFASGLQALGIQPGQHIALFSDNQPRWMIADQGIMAVGGVDAVRGSQAAPDELRYILSHSDSVAMVVQDVDTLNKLLTGEPLPVSLVVLLSDEAPPEVPGIKILNFTQLMQLGSGQPFQPVAIARDALATLMYTSGTSGQPKGVMLTQANLLAQVAGASTVVDLKPGDRVLSILPIWHCYERSFEYFVFANGCSQTYTNIRFVKKDIKDYQPNYMVGVPRLWDSIYEGIQKQFRDQPANKQKLVKFFLEKSDRFVKARRTVQGLSIDNLTPSPFNRVEAAIQMAVLAPLHALGNKLVYQKVRDGLGGQLKFVVSGGGSIAEHLEDFYEIVNITILSGYGLTETAPITHVRRPQRNLRGADGQPLPHTETRIVDPETRKDLPVGQQGLILIRGRQVMQGYYKNPEATHKAIDAEGWFDTGDLGWTTPQGDLTISGRAKDTIVLTSGENIEPLPIENACMRSPYIDQIMLVGQDQKTLGALVVPNHEALQQWATTQPGVTVEGDRTDLTHKAVQDLFRKELNREVTQRPGYRPDERIGVFRLLDEPFSIENGMLTQTLKVKRPVVMDHYGSMINDMFG